MHRVRMSLLGVVGKDDDAIAVIEASDSRVTRLAGEAMAAVPSASAIDAIVMASAALRGDIVYTSDYDDLMRLQAYFRGVRVFRVQPRADE